MKDKPRLTREEIAKIEIGHTSISRGQKVFLCAFFLLLIFAYPLLQFLYEYRTREIRTPADFQPLTIVTHLGGVQYDDSLLQYNHGLVAAIKKYEDALEETSLLRDTLLPPLQEWMVRALGVGNEKVIVGEDGFLFFTSDFNYLVNPGFLRRERLKKRRLSGVQPDPAAAIADFDRQLKARGIRLIVLPVPVKPMLYADKLGGGYVPVQNASYDAFLEALAGQGIEVVDLTQTLFAMRGEGAEPYLKTDTHWTPEGMAAAARLVARTVDPACPAAVPLPAGRPVTALGDIAHMLKVKSPEQIFPAETVTVREYGCEYDRDAEILLLGDSFTNIYDVEAMNWGRGGGFGRALAHDLARPVDVIARNDAGAYATRQLLANELRSGHDRLAGKKVVIYQFAIRELADGDWKFLDLTPGSRPEVEFLTVEEPRTVTGEVLALSEIPRPGSAPYKDHVMSVHLGCIDGDAECQALVYMVSMRDNVWQEAARLKPGQKVAVRLSSWYDAEEEFGSWTRSDLLDDEIILQEPCWGELQP